MTDYLNSRSITQSTKDSYRQDLGAFATWCNDNDVSPLNSGPLTLNRFLSEEQARGLSRSTMRRRWGSLKLFFDYLVDSGVIRQSPMDDDRIVPKPQRVEKAGTRFLSVEDLRALIAAAEARGPNTHVAVCLMGLHGLLPSELRALRVEDVRERRGIRVLVIPDRDRGDWTPLVELTAAAIDRLLELRPSSGPLLVNAEGRRMTYSNLRYRLEQAAEDANLEPVPGARILRSTSAALAFSRAVPVDKVMDMLGTEDVRTVGRFAEQVRPYHYAHAVEAVVNTVMERGHLDEAERLLVDSDVHPAVPTMVAAAALESALREWVLEADIELKNEMKASLATYGGRLRGAGLIRESVVQSLATITEARDDAAHGWFDKITPGRAQRTIDATRHILESHDRPIP